MNIASREHRIGINFKQLQTSCAIEIVGSVPDIQMYQAEKSLYSPDYTLTPLVLFPRCNATDPTALTKPGTVNAKLTNMKWYERIGTTRTLIESTNADYAIVADGSNKGQISVKKNVALLSPLTLEFTAEYIDERTGQVFTFRMTHLVRTTDATDALPVLTIDSPTSLDWNPVRDIANQTITAKLMVGSQDVTASGKCRFFWYRLLDTGALEAITDGTGDNDWEFVSLTDNVYTLDRNFIGDSITLICKAAYAAEGDVPTDPTASIPPVSTVIRRRIPKVEAQISEVPWDVPADTTIIKPKAVVMDAKGVLTDPTSFFNLNWWTKAKGASSYTLRYTGQQPPIPFSEGMMLKLEVEDRGAYAAATSGTAHLTYEDKVLYARSNG